eukprot:SAG31_NODE_10887_length_1087_cov_1.003036_1_plen_70_part_10
MAEVRWQGFARAATTCAARVPPTVVADDRLKVDRCEAQGKGTEWRALASAATSEASGLTVLEYPSTSGTW